MFIIFLDGLALRQNQPVTFSDLPDLDPNGLLVRVTAFLDFGTNSLNFRTIEDRRFKFGIQIDHGKLYPADDRIPAKG